LTTNDKQGIIINKNVDFKGYINDSNPKFYETTKILTGRFLNSDEYIVLVIAANCDDPDFNGIHCNKFSNSQELPNKIEFYQLGN
jgi:hypothetical protein